jgi:hypothetical protein
MARVLPLLGLVLVAGVLALAVRTPERPVPSEVRGHRVLRVVARDVRVLDVVAGARRFRAERAGAGWRIDGRHASPATVAAIDDLLDRLAHLRAVDVFRPRDGADFGLDAPSAMVTAETRRGSRRVTFGATNAGGSAVYARRDGDRRVMQVGVGILSDFERVFYQRDRELAPA